MSIMNKTDRVMSKVALPLIVIAAMLVILIVAIDTRTSSGQNNGYVRVINCIISVPAVKRTQADIEACYTEVEHDLDIQLKRYDNRLN